MLGIALVALFYLIEWWDGASHHGEPGISEQPGLAPGPAQAPLQPASEWKRLPRGERHPHELAPITGPGRSLPR